MKKAFTPSFRISELCAFQKFSYFKLSMSCVILMLSLVSFSSFAQSGSVFRDFNANGTKDTGEPLVSGVLVKAYNAAGTLCSSVTSTGTTSPNYTLPAGCSGQVRVEFDIPDSTAHVICLAKQFDYTSYGGATYGSSVQFVASGAASINFAINFPSDYCQANPDLVVPCYVGGVPASGEHVLVKFPYNSTGSATAPSALADANNIGSVWGLAYAKTTKQLYVSTFLKRHVGLLNDKLGIIYKTDMSIATPTSTAWLDVTVAPLSINIGQASVPTNVARGLTTKAAQSLDAAVFDLIGKVGFGDIDISEDEKTLYFVNLFDKKLYAIDIATKTIVSGFPLTIPNDCNASSGSIRPFGLKFHKGKLFIGSICDAQTSQLAADMEANVYRLDGTTFVNVLSFSMNYTRGKVWSPTATSNKWYPWTNDYKKFNLDAGNGVYTYSQAMLTDIEFDCDDMILAFRDRIGDQIGVYNKFPDGTAMNAEAVAGGDILRAESTGTGWKIENNGKSGTITTAGAGTGQGIGGGEYYLGDDFKGSTSYWHEEISNGGLAILPGQDEIILSAFDPLSNAVGGSGYNQAGVRFIKNSTGAFSDGFMLYDSDLSAGLFSKSGGVADVEVLCSNPPLEIGNRVWNDLDNDGIQDANELGIPNVTIELYDGTTLVGTTTTDSKGNWYFNSVNVPDGSSAAGTQLGVQPNTIYTIKVGSADWTAGAGVGDLKGLSLTKTDATTSAGLQDVSDNDASLVSTIPTIIYTTGTFGQNNHSLDMGFTIPPCPSPNCGTVTVIKN
jgi:hypothetical protein